jgi:hypothetical protein
MARGRDRGGFFLSRGGADVVGSRPNEEATTTNAGKFARSLWVGRQKAICVVARLVRSVHYALRRAPCIRSFSRPTRLTGHTQIGSLTRVAIKRVRRISEIDPSPSRRAVRAGATLTRLPASGRCPVLGASGGGTLGH